MLKNSNGLTMQESINREMNLLAVEYDNKNINEQARLFELRGKVNCAAEFGLITHGEWDGYINRLFEIKNQK